MTTTYTVEINTADGHQVRRVEADDYELEADNSLYLYVNNGDNRHYVALFSGDKWICIREQTPYQMKLSEQVRVMETVG